ncbi:MAG: DMT family transporter, partial [Planctomycetaceae bacterium]|nr:DMT family transporter [Planctomycetaceae bacterium]
TILVATQSGNVTTSRVNLLGNAIILGAALIWSGGTVYSRPLLQQISPMQLSATASVIALPLHWFMARGELESSLPVLNSASLWFILLFSGVLSSGLALPMWNFGVRQAGAAHAAVIQNLIPVVAILAAWISRGETATSPQMIGGALILGGLVLMRRGREK